MRGALGTGPASGSSGGHHSLCLTSPSGAGRTSNRPSLWLLSSSFSLPTKFGCRETPSRSRTPAWADEPGPGFGGTGSPLLFFRYEAGAQPSLPWYLGGGGRMLVGLPCQVHGKKPRSNCASHDGSPGPGARGQHAARCLWTNPKCSELGVQGFSSWTPSLASHSNPTSSNPYVPAFGDPLPGKPLPPLLPASLPRLCIALFLLSNLS